MNIIMITLQVFLPSLMNWWGLGYGEISNLSYDKDDLCELVGFYLLGLEN